MLTDNLTIIMPQDPKWVALCTSQQWSPTLVGDWGPAIKGSRTKEKTRHEGKNPSSRNCGI